MFSDNYINQVRLLLQCMPAIRNQDYFVLKGGTAINLFIHDLPRLSVDIDLAYKHLDNRDDSLKNIQLGLRQISFSIKNSNPNFVIKEKISQEGYLLKLLVHDGKTIIKIEPNFIVRGTLLPVQLGTTCQRIKNEFDSFIDEIPMMATDELYAGKICAALSRQHPRDLFDIKILFETGGITDTIRQAFLVYLVSNSRPIHEILAPNLIDIKAVFEKEFSRMTNENITLEQLLSAREQLIQEINKSLTKQEKDFLLSVKQGTPRYELFPYTHIRHLPALQWKLLNIKKLKEGKHGQLLDKLRKVLEV